MKEIPQELKDNELFRADNPITVNHKPHPFVVGLKHMTYASDHHNGILGEETLRRIPCAQCKRAYEEHTYDTVIAIHLKRDVSAEELRKHLLPLAEMMIKEGVDGFIFIDTGFRIVEGENANENTNNEARSE